MVSGHPRVEQAQGNWGPGMTSGPAQALPGFPACCSGLGSPYRKRLIPLGPQVDLAHLPTLPYSLPSTRAHFCSLAPPNVLGGKWADVIVPILQMGNLRLSGTR